MKYFIFSLLLLPAISGAIAFSGDQTPNASGPVGKVAAKPLFRDPVYDGAADPSLCFDRRERKWLMFYTNRRATLPDAKGVSWVHGTRIGVAESSDHGATWKYCGTADIDYGKEDYTFWAPEVLYHDGLYHMYLTIVPGIFENWNAPRQIIHLTSKDLWKWKFQSQLKLASDRVIDACVIQLPDKTWRLWYKNERDHSFIYYADSPNLYNWTDRGVAISDQHGEGPKVFHWKDSYWMITDVWQGLAVYKSDDCLKWTRQKNNLLKEPGKIATDRAKGQHADVVVSGDCAFLFYFTHQSGKDAKPGDPTYDRRTVMQVVELEYKDGWLTCDRDKPTHLFLQEPAFLQWALKPPMGWNSWDCFATTVTEAQTKAQADYMAKKLARYGWEYVVVDIQWYEPGAKSFNYRQDAKLVMDQWGRLLPALNRFPSAANGAGFKALADYVHGKGLKFGVHLLRGIPRQAVEKNTPIKGTSFHAADIADKKDICPWNPDMYGVDMTKPGAQEYYNSVFDLFAQWGVDFVKVDDISRPYHKHRAEIEAVRKAIDQSGRPMVLSLSPGETALDAADHVVEHANMWRISDDFWDRWPLLLSQFARLDKWAKYCGPGHWPDADMLPLGVVGQGRRTNLTPDEQYTLMTLWCIARSPLIFGGDMTKMDDFTLSLLSNEEVIAVDQESSGNRQLFRSEGLVAWLADAPDSPDKYLAVFNTRDKPPGQDAAGGVKVPVQLKDLGFNGPCKIRDLWKKTDIGQFEEEFAPEINWHGAGLYRVSSDKP
jgi:alpha-galactosidase